METLVANKSLGAAKRLRRPNLDLNAVDGMSFVGPGRRVKSKDGS